MAKKIDWQSSAWLAAVITGAVWLVSYVASLAGQTVNEMFVSVPATSVITGTFGTKVLGYIGGIVPLGAFGTMGFLAVFISAFATVLVGTFFIGMGAPVFFKRGLFGFNGNIGRIFSTIIWGAVPMYLLLVGTAIPSGMTFVAVAIHTMVVAFVATWIAGFLKIKI